MSETLYAILDVDQLGQLDFSNFHQRSSETCRKSLDETKAVVSFDAVKTDANLFGGEILVEESVSQQTLYGIAKTRKELNEALSIMPIREGELARKRSFNYLESIKSGDYIIENKYNIINDARMLPQSIERTQILKKYSSNVDSAGNILQSININGQIVTGIKYNGRGCLGPISNDIVTYTQNEIKNILTGADWTNIEPTVDSIHPSAGNFGSNISIYGDNFYNITGIRLGNAAFEIDSITPTQINFTLPSNGSDDTITLLGKYNDFKTNLFFDYINELPTLNAVSIVGDSIEIDGIRLDNVKFVVFTPDNQPQDMIKIGYPFFTTHNSSKIILAAPEIAGNYSVSLIDIEDREVA